MLILYCEVKLLKKKQTMSKTTPVSLMSFDRCKWVIICDKLKKNYTNIGKIALWYPLQPMPHIQWLNNFILLCLTASNKLSVSLGHPETGSGQLSVHSDE